MTQHDCGMKRRAIRYDCHTLRHGRQVVFCLYGVHSRECQALGLGGVELILPHKCFIKRGVT
jgi:hypothetical protein